MQTDEKQADESLEAEESLGTVSEMEDLGGCKRRVSASVPLAKVREELDRNYRELAQTVQIPGFRKGRVPRQLLESRYGEEIESEVKESIVAASFSEVIAERELQVFSSPEFDNVKFETDADLTYDVEFEVRPDFELPSYRGIEVNSEPAVVTEEEVDAELESIRRQSATFEPADPEDVGADGYMTGSMTLFVDGNEVKKVDKVSFRPHSDVLDHFFIKDLSAQVATCDLTSETPLSFGVTVPPHYPDEVLRGKEAQLELVVHEAYRAKLPDLDERFATAARHESLEELTEAIRKTVQRRKEREVERGIEDKILNELTAATEIEVPEGLVESQLRRRRMEEEQALLEQGYSAKQVQEYFVKKAAGDQTAERPEDAELDEIRKAAKKYFVLEAIAEKEKIFATENVLEDRIAHLAQHYGMTPEKLRAELEKSSQLDELRQTLRHEKVREFLRRKAKVTSSESTPEAVTEVSGEDGGEESSGEA